jgi:hypothetical protein
LDKDTLIKELCDEAAMKGLFMERLRRLNTFNTAQTSAPIEESPEFHKSLKKMDEMFAPLNLDPSLVKFILHLNLAVLHTMVENNQHLLSLMHEHQK